MFQGSTASDANDETATTLPSTSEYLTTHEVARRIDRSPWWVREMARHNRIAHYRKGERPPAGRRDVRPLVFTEEQVRAIEQRLHALELVADEDSA